MLLERQDQLSALTGLLDSLPQTGGRVALVRGEAGIGKSALIERFVADVAPRAHVLMGACDDLHTPQTLGPIWDVARREPSLAEPIARGDLRGVMEALLAVLSRPLRPTVLVLEDTQWADDATLDVIKFLGRRIARSNGVLVLTYRDGEVDDRHPLRLLLGQLPPANVVRLSLAPLSAEAVACMVVDTQLDPAQVVELTAGNPLFVTEVLASGTARVPPSVRDAVVARLAQLSPAARQLLHIVAVVPGRAERELVTALSDASASVLIECERHDLLVSDATTICFRHELLRRAVEASLTAEQRRQLNRAVLAALDPDGDPARLVHHAEEAGDVEAIVANAVRAARAATAMGSRREAAAHYRTLESHLDRIELRQRAEIIADWTRLELDIGGSRAVELARRSADLHRQLGDPVALARVLVGSVRIFETNSHPEEAVAAMEEAIALLEAHEPGSDLAMALIEMAWLDLRRGRGASAGVALTDRAIAIAQAVDDDLALTRALILKGAIRHNMRKGDGVPLVEEAVRRAAKGGYRHEEVLGMVNLAGMSGDVRAVGRAADMARRARETAARYEMVAFEMYATTVYAEIQLWQGEWAGAEDTLSTVLGYDDADAEVVAWRLLGLLQARRGRAEALATIERAWAAAEATGELQFVDPAAGVLAEHVWLTDDRDPRHMARLRRVTDEGLDKGTPWPSGMLSFWMWALGELPSVPQHVPFYFRSVADGDPARAAAFWRSMGVPYEEGLALLHGDEADRIRAIEIFEGLGATGTANRVRRDLRSEGIKVARGRSSTTRSHPAGLTARQAEVLALLTEGLANAEISERLFLSLRTVENHVAAVLMKLDAPDRRSAVDRARERGLI